MSSQRLLMRGLLAMMTALLLVQAVQLGSALWFVSADAFAVSGFVGAALLFKGVLLLLNLVVVVVLWRVSGFGGARRSSE